MAHIIDAMDVSPRVLIESFIKNEAAMKTPRLISAWADMRWIAQVSAYQYAFKEQVLLSEANQHWFYAGKTPPVISADLQLYATSVEHGLAETDYSNMDGMTSAALQEAVAFAIELRYFHPQYHPELQRLHKNLLRAPARSKSFGFKYEAGVGVKSGSPTTTNHNTIHSAFHEYCAIRRVYSDFTPEEAFMLLGPKCGDDGVTRAELATTLERVVADWGMKLKVERCRPETGLTFLARVFPDIETTLTSFQDPLRTLRKLHMTFRDPNVPLADAALDRTAGYLVTDKHTPIISEYCELIQRHYANTGSSFEVRRKRKTHALELNYWARDEDNSWIQDPKVCGGR